MIYHDKLLQQLFQMSHLPAISLFYTYGLISIQHENENEVFYVFWKQNLLMNWVLMMSLKMMKKIGNNFSYFYVYADFYDDVYGQISEVSFS